MYLEGTISVCVCVCDEIYCGKMKKEQRMGDKRTTPWIEKNNRMKRIKNILILKIIPMTCFVYQRHTRTQAEAESEKCHCFYCISVSLPSLFKQQWHVSHSNCLNNLIWKHLIICAIEISVLDFRRLLALRPISMHSHFGNECHTWVRYLSIIILNLYESFDFLPILSNT